MAEMALQHLAEGNNIKAFMGILTQSDLAQGETRGERLGFWNKRMLPQVFKWDDEKKRILLTRLEETVFTPMHLHSSLKNSDLHRFKSFEEKAKKMKLERRVWRCHSHQFI